MERVGCGDQADEQGAHVQGRVQLRRLAQPRRTVVDRRQLVGFGESDYGRPEQSCAGVFHQLAGQAHLPGSHVLPPVLKLGRDDDFGVLRRPHEREHELCVLGRCERRHGQRQRFDLHPARHVGDEFQTADGQRPDLQSRRAGRGVRAVDPGRQLSQLASWPVRRAQRRVPPGGQPRRPEPHAGRVREGQRQAPLGPDPARHHELRQPVEPRLGCRPAPRQLADSDASERGSAGAAHLQPAVGQRQPDHLAAANQRRHQ